MVLQRVLKTACQTGDQRELSMEDPMVDVRVQPMGSVMVLLRVLQTACRTGDQRELSMKDQIDDVRVQSRGLQRECRTRHERVHS
jgi:hypothetical protein